MPNQSAIEIGLAAGWGVCATWIFWWLSLPVYSALFSAYQPTMHSLLQNGWTGAEIRPYFQALTVALPALLYGIIFGFPLGVVVKRSVVRAWIVFVAAFLVALIVRMSLAALGFQSIVENLVSSFYLFTLLATLLFAVVGHRARLAYANHRAAA
jgi:hypothetical protein